MGRQKASNIDVIIGTKLREIREYKGLILKEVALPLGMSHQGWQKYETGIRRLSLNQLFVLCEFFKIDVIKFISSIIDKP